MSRHSAFVSAAHRQLWAARVMTLRHNTGGTFNKGATMTRRALSLIACALFIGCAGRDRPPPSTLLQAREAYALAERSDSARFDPAGLQAARSSLDRAEALYVNQADSVQVETAAYVALRRAQRAKLDGETSRHELRFFDAQLQAKQLGNVAPGPAPDFDTEADAALQQLAPQLTIMDQYRSTLVRLPCESLFRADAPQLSAAAPITLDPLARALKEQGERAIVVVGYTDAGDTERNVQLSQRRAQAVADYLNAHGVPRDKLAVRGLGSNNPVAGNDTAQGRRENSRIEILVRKPERPGTPRARDEQSSALR